MEFKQLEAFVAVVDYGSFSEVARRLTSQHNLRSSAHIRSLEDELHMKLIIHTTKQHDHSQRLPTMTIAVRMGNQK